MISFAALANNPTGGLISPEAIALKKSAPNKRVLRILLAEDNPTDQEITGKMLKMLGHCVDTVENGAEAVAAAGRVDYDLFIMDVQMPEMDGFETARAIRKLWPSGDQPKIIAITAYALKGDREKCLDAGMDDYISKPVKLDDLEEMLAKIEENR